MDNGPVAVAGQRVLAHATRPNVGTARFLLTPRHTPIWRGSTHRQALNAWLPGRARRLLVVVHVGLTTVFVGWVLMRLVAMGQGRVVVLVLMAGGQMRPVL